VAEPLEYALCFESGVIGMAVIECVTCQKEFDTQASEAVPFCSSRCRQIDLGRWLNEEYAMPMESTEEEPLADAPTCLE